MGQALAGEYRGYDSEADGVQGNAVQVNAGSASASERLWKGALSGLIGGAAATLAMTAFQLAWSEAEKRCSGGSSQATTREHTHRADGATLKMTEAASEAIANRPLDSELEVPVSYAVHFAFGAAMGGVYGVTSEFIPFARTGYGLMHGLGVWLGMDALALPVMRLSPPVTDRNAIELSYELLAHSLYGMATEAVRKKVRAAL
jgi:putative membrane protein